MSRKIDINNYEEFALDYLEGTLSPEQASAFQAFLLLNPNIETELSEMASFEMPAFEAELSEEFKSGLKMEVVPTAGIDESNYEESFALAVDADLNPELAINTAQFAKANPALLADHKAYQKTKLKPISSIIFSDKNAIKQSVPLWAAYAKPLFRVAAAILLLLGVASILRFVTKDEIYNPRQSNIGLAQLEIPALRNYESASNTVSEEKSDASIINQAQPEPVYLASTNTRLRRIEILKAKAISEKSAMFEIEQRAFAVATPMPIEPLLELEQEDIMLASAETPNQRPSVLNVTQFIGQRLFGLEPNKSDNTKELIREGLATVVDRNELVAVNREGTDNNKKKFQLIAGKFELSRVAYK